MNSKSRSDEHDIEGYLSLNITFINETRGSTFVGSILCSVYESDFNATLVLGVHLLISISLSRSTTYFPSGFTLTSTLDFPIGLTISPT